MPSAFKRRLPPQTAAGPAAAPAAPAAARTADAHTPHNAAASAPLPPRSSFASGHTILDALLPQGGPVRLLLPAPHLGHPRPLEMHELPAAHAAAGHAAALALLGAGRALADGERVLVVAPHADEARAWAARIPAAPATAGSGVSAEAAGPSARASSSATPAPVAAKAAGDEDSLGSAARYAYLVPQLAARGVPSGGAGGGEALLDLTRTLGTERARQLETQGTLRCAALPEGSGEAEAARLLRQAQQE